MEHVFIVHCSWLRHGLSTTNAIALSKSSCALLLVAALSLLVVVIALLDGLLLVLLHIGGVAGSWVLRT